MNAHSFFNFNYEFDEDRGICQISFLIPQANKLASYWEGRDDMKVPEETDQGLISHFEGFCSHGEFIVELCELPEEIFEDVEEAALFGATENITLKLLGSWTHKREGRKVAILWTVPDWFIWPNSMTNVDLSGFDDFCKDWYISYEMEEDDW